MALKIIKHLGLQLFKTFSKFGFKKENAAGQYDMSEIPALSEQFSCYLQSIFYYNIVANAETVTFQRCVELLNQKFTFLSH